MIKHAINQHLALSILIQIHVGNNSVDELARFFNSEQDFGQTLSDMSMESNSDGMLNLDRPSYTYTIQGTESGVWDLDIHDFLREHGYMSILS